MILEALQKFNMLGLIDPDTAKKIGEILGVRYIVYGNVVDVVVEVDKALKGEGKSASSFFGEGVPFIVIVEKARDVKLPSWRNIGGDDFKLLDTGLSRSVSTVDCKIKKFDTDKIIV